MTSPISYYGGKKNLATKIIKLIPPHQQYVEPFFGGGAVYFKKEKSENEVINDLDNRVVNFYQQLKTNFANLQTFIISTLHSDFLHQQAKIIMTTGSTLGILNWSDDEKIQQAWAFWVQTQMSFGKKINSGFAFDNDGTTNHSVFNKRKVFDEKILNRIENTEIFCRDALTLITLKDNEKTFFYIDPPYFNSNCGHYKGYSEQNFIDLLNVLSTIKGKFILSSYI